MQQITKRFMNWASILEDNTREQVEMTSKMPFIYPHVALMPDAHLGKGCAVGAVLPTLGAIMPAAVGVDIGCVDADTEYLAPDGWHRISEYVSGEVMQYDPETGEGSFVEPQQYIKREQTEDLLHFRTKYGIDQMLTPDHRVLRWAVKGRDCHEEMEVVSAAEHAEEHESLVLGSKARFETSFAPSIVTWLPLTDEELRVQVMFMADGSLSSPKRGVVKVKKERKVIRARQLLGDAGIPFNERFDGECVSFVFAPPTAVKSYESFWEASRAQLRVIAEECLLWDGSLEDQVFFTRDKASADFIHYAFAATGSRSVMRQDEHYRDGAIDYRVFRTARTKISMSGSPVTSIERVPSPDGFAYCFTVPSSFLVLRRNGNIFMTGNCGMAALRLDVTGGDLGRRDLTELRRSIEEAIPLSPGHYNTGTDAFTQGQIEDLERSAASLGVDPDSYASNWRMQLGSLGGGNHFIEVCVDESDHIWLFLHSGSRGVGNKIATHHIKVAQKQCAKRFIELPHKDLAYLVEGDPEFWAYIRDLRWAQEFALRNRVVMMERVFSAFRWWLDSLDVLVTQEVNCHHNYTSQERHFGKDVWLSRKGAIDASEGTWGLIPGSMGDKSYVVLGRGSRLALNSSPHGAGRSYGRKHAERAFTYEQLQESMAGIEWSGSAEFLDEIPSAYKPIDQVMEDAADLVEVKHTLRQVINIKGT